jgi:hypothetical protein
LTFVAIGYIVPINQGNMTMSKTDIINLKIAILIKSGMEVDKAMDAVMGAGSYKRISDEIYNYLNEKYRNN